MYQKILIIIIYNISPSNQLLVSIPKQFIQSWWLFLAAFFRFPCIVKLMKQDVETVEQSVFSEVIPLLIFRIHAQCTLIHIIMFISDITKIVKFVSAVISCYGISSCFCIKELL